MPRELCRVTEAGAIFLHLGRLTDKDLPSIEAELVVARNRGEPPSIIQAYQDVINGVRKGEDFLTLRVTALVALDGKAPPGLPLSGAPVEVISPMWERFVGVIPAGQLSQVAIVPVHIGEGLLPIPVGRTIDGMAAQIDWGGPTSAKHILLVGRTRAGKSTLGKLLAYRTLERVPEARVVVYDLKGEYTYRLPESGESVSLFGGKVVRGAGIWPGEMTLSAPPYDAMATAEYEAFLVSEVLSTLGHPRVPDIEISLKRAYAYVHERGIDRERVLWAIRDKICREAGIREGSIANTVLFGSRAERIGNMPGSYVVDLSWAPYGSPEQVAMFRWSVGTAVPLTGDAKVPRTMLFIEEARLLGGELSTLLRTAGGKGVSLVLITQSPQDVQQVVGAAEQFSVVAYACAGEEQAIAVARTVFGVAEDFFAPGHKEGIRQYYGVPYGWGCNIQPNGIYVCEYHVPPEFLERIKMFNARAIVKNQEEI